jgi:hypothetical protein
MKKEIKIIKKIISLSLFSLLTVCSSNFVQAALVPACGKTTGTAEETAPCTICHMIIGIQGIIDFGFKIFVGVGILMVVISGIMYIISAGQSGMMDAAKSRLKNVLIGFAVMLGAWLIVNVTMLVIGTKSDLGISATSWHTFKCVPQSTLTR